MKTVPTDIFYYDAEWIPCLRTGRLVCRLPDTATDDEVLAAMWQRGGATAEKPHPFLKLALSRIVSISAIHRHQDADGHVTFKLRSFPETADPSVPEAEIIVSFLEEVAAHKAQLVGFNCANADLPLLVQRGVAHNCHCPNFGHRPEKPWLGDDYFSKYSEAHLDLANVWMAGGRGSAVMPSLDEMAAAALVPGKLEHTGGSVLDLWRTGQFAEITHYNETDACTTYLLWANTARFFGHLTPEQREVELAQFQAWLLELSIERPHFEHFVAVWRERRKLALVSAPLAQDHRPLDKVDEVQFRILQEFVYQPSL